MNDATQTAVIISMVGSLLVLLIGVIGFAAKRFFGHVDKLQESMENLRETMAELGERFVTQEQYRADMVLLRRASDRCPHDDCPLQSDTAPGVVLTGSGAKHLQDLLKAANEQRGGTR